MATLKTDLLNELRNQKYFDEIELARLAEAPNMNYKDKIQSLDLLLDRIAMTNQKINLALSYFIDPGEVPVPAPAPVPEPEQKQQDQLVGKPLPGQSHGE